MARTVYHLAIVISVFLSSQGHAADFQCPAPTTQIAANVAARIVHAPDADLKGEVQSTINNLWASYPNADRVAIAQNLLSTSCNLIKSSGLSDERKLDRWTRIIELLTPSLSPSATSSPDAVALQVKSAASRGYTANKQGDYDLAVAEYKAAIRLDPGYAPAYAGLGEAYYLKSNYEMAIDNYSEAIRLDHSSAHYFNLRGNVYFSQRKYGQAIKDYSDSIRLNAKSPVYWHNRGAAYFENKDYDAAVTNYEEAIRLRPNYAEATTELRKVRQHTATFIFRLCNSTGIGPITVAVVGKPKFEDKSYVLRAWYPVSNEACIDLGSFANFASLYYTATGPNGTTWSGSDFHYCVSRNQVNKILPDVAPPCVQGDQLYHFKKIDVHEGDRIVTHNLVKR